MSKLTANDLHRRMTGWQVAYDQPIGVTEGRRQLTDNEYDGTQYFWIFPERFIIGGEHDGTMRSWRHDEMISYLSSPGQFPKGNGDMMGDNFNEQGDEFRITEALRFYSDGRTTTATQMFYPGC